MVIIIIISPPGAKIRQENPLLDCRRSLLLGSTYALEIGSSLAGLLAQQPGGLAEGSRWSESRNEDGDHRISDVRNPAPRRGARTLSLCLVFSRPNRLSIPFRLS